MGALLLVHNRSSPSILDCIFLPRILEMKLNYAHQELDGRLIDVTTMGELLLRRPKGGHGCLIEV